MNDEVSCSGLGFGCSLIDNFCRCGLGCRHSLIEEVSSGLGFGRSIDVELCCSGLGCGCSSIDEVDYCLDNR